MGHLWYLGASWDGSSQPWSALGCNPSARKCAVCKITRQVSDLIIKFWDWRRMNAASPTQMDNMLSEAVPRRAWLSFSHRMSRLSQALWGKQTPLVVGHRFQQCWVNRIYRTWSTTTPFLPVNGPILGVFNSLSTIPFPMFGGWKVDQ
jgi:hypothetical protein